MPSTKTSHFLFFPIPAWGHIRPFCVLASRLVREQENVVVTFMVASNVLKKTRAEVSRQFLGESSCSSAEALQRIRILSPPRPSQPVSSSRDPVDSETMKALADAYPAAYQTLYEAKPITCSSTGTTFDAVPPPCAAVLDFYVLPQLRATRAISGDSVPIIACITAGAGATIRHFGPESMGGVGDISARNDAMTARTGLSDDEFGPKIFYGKLVQVPGLPPMYDYEFFPQTLLFDNPINTTVRGYASLRECDATFINTSYAYDSVSLNAMKQWFSDMQKEIYVLGPLLPPGYGIESQKGEEGSSVDIETFLGEMLVQRGKGSVFFISFGTYFYPSVSEYVDELIEALIEKKAPFIFAHASESPAKISEQVIEKVKSSGLGMLTTWSPQQFILNHPATGWFVSHSGFNSVTESLGSGVPLICWPITADQPAAAAHLTENLNVAFELFQVRTGNGLKPLARNGLAAEGTREAVGIEIRQTIDLCRSEKGQVMKNNAEQLKVKFAKAWEDDGAARREVRKILQKYTN